MQTAKQFRVTFGGVLVFFLVAPLVIPNVHFQHLMVMLLLYATLSQSWNLIGGYAGQISFGHAVFFGIGAYAAMAPLNQWGLTPWVGMVIGGLIAMVVAVIVGFPVFRLRQRGNLCTLPKRKPHHNPSILVSMVESVLSSRLQFCRCRW